MKHNLKTFPDGQGVDTIDAWIQACDWKRDFEKELREMTQLIALNIDSGKDTIRSHARGQLALIEELLGDEVTA